MGKKFRQANSPWQRVSYGIVKEKDRGLIDKNEIWAKIRNQNYSSADFQQIW